jgi:hypothetical protein
MFFVHLSILFHCFACGRGGGGGAVELSNHSVDILIALLLNFTEKHYLFYF